MDEFTKSGEDIQNATNQILKTTDDVASNDSNDILNDNISPSEILDKIDTDNLNNIESENNLLENNDSLEKIDLENANTTNCLALTIKEEHKLVAVKNVVIHSLKVTWKVIVSTVALHLLKIFF